MIEIGLSAGNDIRVSGVEKCSGLKGKEDAIMGFSLCLFREGDESLSNEAESGADGFGTT